MFDIGFTELVLLAGLGLIVLGPQRLPKVAAQLGRWVGQARRMSRTLMYQLRQEVDLDDPRPFSARRPAEASAGAKPKAAQKDKGGNEKEKGADKKEKEADTAQSSVKDDAEQSQSGE
ncbi:MAG: Sec-independent protein translocase protein TatB [Gammaproteobacteria bacterium]|nr:Sec-independent protein translocase protein TatB [Gammaproteobacteria bacterium]